MKNKMRHLLISAAVAAVLLCVESSSGLCRAQSLPDLRIRMIKVTGQHEVTVVVANYGHADSLGCYVTLYLLNPSDKKEIWTGRESVKPLAAMSSVDVAFNMGRARPGGLLLRAMADSSQRVKEENEDNNWGELLVPADTKPTPTPPPADPSPAPAPARAPAPVPDEKPRLSPDLAAVDIYFEDGEVVAVIQNVGDRMYAPDGAGYKDSFTRNVKLTREVRVGTKTSTQEIGVSDVPWVNVGEKIQFGFKRPKNVAAATQYTWILTIDGDDPDLTNNTFKKVQKVNKID